MSMTGSALYVIGSAGFLPSVVAYNPLIGIWGFVLGSAFIAWSQVRVLTPATPLSTASERQLALVLIRAL